MVKILVSTNWIKLMDKREFTKDILDKNSETFVGHISAPEVTQI